MTAERGALLDEEIACTPWCTEADHTTGCAFRGDQSCWGVMRKVVLGLDPHAPPLPVSTEELGAAPGISAYAFRGFYQLPTVKLHVYRERENDNTSVDADFLMTPSEAIELALNLIATVEDIAGGAR